MSSAFRPVRLIVSPYHVGQFQHRVGNGPGALIAPLVQLLTQRGIPLAITTIKQVDEFEGEIGRSFEILRRISGAVTAAVQADEFPVVLAGNCHSSVAVATGLRDAGLDLSLLDMYWTDAHADAQVPDDNVSGYFDSMGCAMMAGLCWKAHMQTLTKQDTTVVLPLDRIIFIGVRDSGPSEMARIVEAGASIIAGGQPGVDYAGLLAPVAASRGAERRSLVHVDLDALDPTIGHANEYSVPHGLLAKDINGVLQVLAGHRPTSLTVASFNPHLENGDRIVEVAVQSIANFLVAALGPSS